MNRVKAADVLLTIAALIVPLTVQSQQNDLQAELKVRVEITADKREYGLGEVVRFRATLINASDSAVYVAKTWWYAGGGNSGFIVEVKQLTGKNSGAGCGMAWDPGPVKDARTPDQVLREDFVRLGRGELIGFEDIYKGCVIKYPGTYQIVAEYWAVDRNIHDAEALSNGKASMLRGRIRSEPFTFRVRASKAQASENQK